MSDDAVSLIGRQPREALPEDLRQLCDEQVELLGFVPNIVWALSLRPQLLRNWAAMMHELLAGSKNLTETDCETVAVAVSAHNRCHYCQVTHGSALRRLSGDAALVDQLVTNHRSADVDERMRTLIDVAIEITERPHDVGAAQIARLRAVGLEDEDVLCLVAIVGLFNMSNRVATVLGWKPNREYFTLGR